MTEFTSRYDTLLKKRQAEARAANVTAHCLQPHGHPGPAICQAASDNDVNLVVVGNRDRSTLTELVPGSVSNYVIHHALSSVTVVHADTANKGVSVEEPSAFSFAA